MRSAIASLFVAGTSPPACGMTMFVEPACEAALDNGCCTHQLGAVANGSKNVHHPQGLERRSGC